MHNPIGSLSVALNPDARPCDMRAIDADFHRDLFYGTHDGLLCEAAEGGAMALAYARFTPDMGGGERGGIVESARRVIKERLSWFDKAAAMRALLPGVKWYEVPGPNPVQVVVHGDYCWFARSLPAGPVRKLARRDALPAIAAIVLGVR